MKKTFLKKIILFFIVLECLFLFNSSCGLDVFTMISPPYTVINKPAYYDVEVSSKYFEFYTNETEDNEFDGTAVYYKIYNNVEKLQSDVASLVSLANDSQNNYNAPYRLIEKGYFYYQPLRKEGNSSQILVEYTGYPKKVHIRLSDYKNFSDFSACIKISENNIGKPLRNLSNKSTFNFFAKTSYDRIPEKNDDDVRFSGNATDDGLYVSMFAVAIGHNLDYTPIYSNILYLGSVKINPDDFS